MEHPRFGFGIGLLAAAAMVASGSVPVGAAIPRPTDHPRKGSVRVRPSKYSGADLREINARNGIGRTSQRSRA